VQRRFYYITKKGLEFLEAYRRTQDLLVYLESERRVMRKERPTAPVDFVGISE
jgi:predicted transcriptional regulator